MSNQDTLTVIKNFIVLEGIDGSGTTTQMRAIAESLDAAGIPNLMTAEPTARPEGALVRKILRGDIDADPGTVAYLFAADRNQHIYGRDGILEAIQAGKFVICDRYVLSSLAYQGLTCGEELPRMLNSKFPAPGLTLYFKIDPETSMGRMAGRSHLEIYEKLHIQKQVCESYDTALSRAKADGWNIRVIDAGKPIREVTGQVLGELGQYIGRKLSPA